MTGYKIQTIPVVLLFVFKFLLENNMADLPRIEKNDILILLTYSMDFPFVIICTYIRQRMLPTFFLPNFQEPKCLPNILVSFFMLAQELMFCQLFSNICLVFIWYINTRQLYCLAFLSYIVRLLCCHEVIILLKIASVKHLYDFFEYRIILYYFQLIFCSFY